MFIVITGPKHSGKTLCAGALEKITGYEKADLDGIVERETGKSPGKLYREGPEVFRKAEAASLSSLIRETEGKQKTLIIAAGGGLIDNSDAMALLGRDSGAIIVYLEVSPETAWQRILRSAKDGALPPFLDTENPKETHFALHSRRAEAYRALADFSVSAEHKSPEEIAGVIAELLKSHPSIPK